MPRTRRRPGYRGVAVGPRLLGAAGRQHRAGGDAGGGHRVPAPPHPRHAGHGHRRTVHLRRTRRGLRPRWGVRVHGDGETAEHPRRRGLARQRVCDQVAALRAQTCWQPSATWKQGFCFEDSFKYDGEKSGGYNCGYQGITSGWGDWYYKQLGGQWIDITGVSEGDYIVRVTINLGSKKGGKTVPIFDEGSNRYPNVVETPIHVPDPRNKLTP
ncbi:MAG: hypothetical protein EXR51_01975 [Dehalococcoidia bacterium]|nr:hypothetical protein [Dehalococcoidia bacterium]